MAMSNHERIGKGLEALQSGLAPYVARELKAHYGEAWWREEIEASLQPAQEGRRRRKAKSPEEQLGALDVHALLGVLWHQWNAVFQAKLGPAGRTYVSELRDVRNKWAHQEAFTVEDAHRALDTMARLLQMISSSEADQTARLARDLLRLRFEEETRRELRRGAEVVTETGTPTGLKPWREVVTPHPDVASGRYQQAEFAADLGQVLSGEADDEYQNPHEFFRRTYLTQGLAHLIRLALRRLTGSGGDPVVELQTNFGGGKTHSLLALYHNLWERQDKSLLIMPVTVPLDSPAVRYELTRYLPEGWGAIIDTDIDGPTSRPLDLDRANPNLGRYSACRRVTRTIFVGSAPSVAAQKVRGLEEVRIKLGCVQPGEMPATFGDALRRLGEQLTDLYGDGTRYWFDTHPSVNRLAADRAEQWRPDVVEEEIVRRLRERRDRGDFAGVPVAPESNADVPDKAAVRLVVLVPRHVHRARLDPSPARAEAEAILERRGASPRLYRNMLVFLAPDNDRLAELDRAVRQLLAWQSMEDEEEQLNLDAYQRSQVAAGIKRGEETVAARLQETYTWLLVPTQEQDGQGPVIWEVSRLAGGGESFVLKASKKLRGRDAGLIAQELVQHLTGLVGAEVEVTIEIHAKIPDGAPEHVVRTVTENCRTLRFKTHGFETE